MTNNDQLIADGNNAEHLLKDEIFVRVVNALIDHNMQEMLITKPEESQVRERYYYQSRGLQEIVSTLNQMVAVRDQILFNNEE